MNMKICCIFLALLVLIDLIEVSGMKRAIIPEEYVSAYNLDRFNENYRFYTNRMPSVQRSLFGKFRIRGERYTLPAVATRKLLFTKDSIPFWFQIRTITIYHYVVGSPIRLSTLLKNGTTIVQYLGDKLDPLCTHLNCQLELVVGLNDWEKKELAYPRMWSMILSISAPFPKKVKDAFRMKPESNLQCMLDE